jgi:hypothetical protein
MLLHRGSIFDCHPGRSEIAKRTAQSWVEHDVGLNRDRGMQHRWVPDAGVRPSARRMFATISLGGLTILVETLRDSARDSRMRRAMDHSEVAGPAARGCASLFAL